jgi:hypothetical protein
MRNLYGILIGKTNGIMQLGRPGLDEKIILKMINEYSGRMWAGFIWLRIGGILVRWVINFWVP